MPQKIWSGNVPFTCIYPKLKAWMQRNDWCESRLAHEAGIPEATIHCNLIGRHEMKMYTIRKVLKATGLTFEEAFGIEITPEEAREER